MSDDGSIVVIVYWTYRDAEVYVKGNAGFRFSQILPSSNGGINGAISTNSSIFLRLSTNVINYYVRGINGDYEVAQALPSSGAMDVRVCASEEFLAVSGNTNYLNLYQKNNGIFSLYSTESCSLGYPKKIAFSQDCQWMAYSCTNDDVKIYQRMPPFTLVQTLALANLTNLAISGSNLIALVYSPWSTKHYSYNGSQFVPQI